MVAAGLTACAPGSTPVYRLAGDEFALLGPLAAAELAALPAALRVHLRGVPGPRGCGSLRLDLGVALRTPGDSAGAWLHRADQAMYTDKRRLVRLDGPAACGPLP